MGADDGANGLGQSGDHIFGGHADLGEFLGGGSAGLGVQGAAEGCGIARCEPLGQQRAYDAREHIARSRLGERGRAAIHGLQDRKSVV